MVFVAVWSLVIGHWSLVIAQVPPLRTEEWKLDIIHRTRGRLPLRGLILSARRPKSLSRSWTPNPGS